MRVRKTDAKEIEAILRLDAQRRFEHFVKRVVDDQTVWGLWKDGWALMADDNGKQAFPLWPAMEYADLLRTGDWSAYESSAIPLHELLTDLLPKLASRGVPPAVFPTPSGKGVTPSPEELADALRMEMDRYA